MTVEELMDILEDCNPEAEVVLCSTIHTFSGISDLVDVVIEEYRVYLQDKEYTY